MISFEVPYGPVFGVCTGGRAGGADSCLAQGNKITLTVNGGKETENNVPITVPLEVTPETAKTPHVRLKEAKQDGLLVGQWTLPGVMTEGIPAKDKNLMRRDLHFVLPELKAGATLTFTLEPLQIVDQSKVFHWKEIKEQATELWRGNQPIFRYMHPAYDNSSEEKRNKTYKVFHHLFDPTGTRIVTNGGQSDPGSETKKLLYPHHRGLMFAFNKITYGNGKSADTWHAKPKDTHESHEGILSAEAGLVLGRHRVAIDWHGPDREVFAKEEREMTVYGIEGGTLVEFATRLKTTGGKVRLDGDPQHAGFQFRAANEVAEKSAKETYYLRPDGKGKPGETRNWTRRKRAGQPSLGRARALCSTASASRSLTSTVRRIPAKSATVSATMAALAAISNMTSRRIVPWFSITAFGCKTAK